MNCKFRTRITGVAEQDNNVVITRLNIRDCYVNLTVCELKVAGKWVIKIQVQAIVRLVSQYDFPNGIRYL